MSEFHYVTSPLSLGRVYKGARLPCQWIGARAHD